MLYTSGYATMVHGQGAIRCTTTLTTFANLEITLL